MKENTFTCPQCSGHHFGTSLDTAEDEFGSVADVTITEHQCHDQYLTGCRWRGQWPPVAAPAPAPTTTEPCNVCDKGLPSVVAIGGKHYCAACLEADRRQAPAAPLRCHPAAADAVLAALLEVLSCSKSLISASLHQRCAAVAAEAMQPILSATELKQNTFSLSIWLGESLHAALDRAPLDAVQDAELLLGALRLHLEANR